MGDRLHLVQHQPLAPGHPFGPGGRALEAGWRVARHQRQPRRLRSQIDALARVVERVSGVQQQVEVGAHQVAAGLPGGPHRVRHRGEPAREQAVRLIRAGFGLRAVPSRRLRRSSPAAPSPAQCRRRSSDGCAQSTRCRQRSGPPGGTARAGAPGRAACWPGRSPGRTARACPAGRGRPMRRTWKLRSKSAASSQWAESPSITTRWRKRGWPGSAPRSAAWKRSNASLAVEGHDRDDHHRVGRPVHPQPGGVDGRHRLASRHDVNSWPVALEGDSRSQSPYKRLIPASLRYVKGEPTGRS